MSNTTQYTLESGAQSMEEQSRGDPAAPERQSAPDKGGEGGQMPSSDNGSFSLAKIVLGDQMRRTSQYLSTFYGDETYRPASSRVSTILDLHSVHWLNRAITTHGNGKVDDTQLATDLLQWVEEHQTMRSAFGVTDDKKDWDKLNQLVGSDRVSHCAPVTKLYDDLSAKGQMATKKRIMPDFQNYTDIPSAQQLTTKLNTAVQQIRSSGLTSLG